MFARARGASPCILLLDQLETLAPPRGSDSSTELTFDRLLSTLLIEMDGALGNSNTTRDNHVIVLGTTTSLDLLDNAILRPGRLDQHVYIPLPDIHAREQIFIHYLSKINLNPTCDVNNFAKFLSKKTEGYSGAMIEVTVVIHKIQIIQ